MATSNSLFFAVRPVPPLEQVGWTVRVLDVADYSTVVAVVNDYVELTVGPELNAPGAGSISLDADSPFWRTTLLTGDPATALLDDEYLWEAWEDGILRFQFLGTNVVEQILQPDETRGIVVSGPGIAHVLSWACIMPIYFPPAKATLAKGSKVWRTYPITWSAMHIWLDQLNRAKARGTIGWVRPMFTTSADSAGQPWQKVSSPETTADNFVHLDPGTNLLDLLTIHTGQDLTRQFAQRTEWVMWPGFKLDVRRVIGTHREARVIFFEGALDLKERTRVRDEIANYVVTVDAYGQTSFASNAASVARHHQREQLQNQNLYLTDAARRDAVTEVYLAQRQDEKSQWTIQVPYDQPDRKVFVDYDLGDWIGVVRYLPGQTSAVEQYRVMAITVNVREGAPPTVELTLQSKLDTRDRALQKQLTTILNSISQNSSASLPKPTLYTSDYPSDGWDLGWSPTDGWYGTPWGESGGSGGGGVDDSGAYTGIRVFIQLTDPGTAANVGDFWLKG